MEKYITINDQKIDGKITLRYYEDGALVTSTYLSGLSLYMYLQHYYKSNDVFTFRASLNPGPTPSAFHDRPPLVKINDVSFSPEDRISITTENHNGEAINMNLCVGLLIEHLNRSIKDSPVYTLPEPAGELLKSLCDAPPLPSNNMPNHTENLEGKITSVTLKKEGSSESITLTLKDIVGFNFRFNDGKERAFYSTEGTRNLMEGIISPGVGISNPFDPKSSQSLEKLFEKINEWVKRDVKSPLNKNPIEVIHDRNNYRVSIYKDGVGIMDVPDNCLIEALSEWIGKNSTPIQDLIKARQQKSQSLSESNQDNS